MLGVTECGACGGGLEASDTKKPHTYQTHKSFNKLLTDKQQTVNIFTIQQLYRHATLLLGVRVGLGGVYINT